LGKGLEGYAPSSGGILTGIFRIDRNPQAVSALGKDPRGEGILEIDRKVLVESCQSKILAGSSQRVDLP
jgi:hypothetical protein